MFCASCGLKGHSRSTSHLCPNHKDRPGREKPPFPTGESEESGYWTEHQRCIKVGLQGLLRNTQLYGIIQDVVSETTRLSYEASRLLQFHVQRTFEANLDTPRITNETWVRQCFAVLQGKTVTDPELKTSFDIYVTRRTLREPLPKLSVTPPQAVTIAVKNYVSVIETHIDRLYLIVLKRWMVTGFKMRGLPSKAARRMAAFMMDLLLDTDLKVEDVNDYDLKTIIQMVIATREGWETKLRFIHDTTRVLMVRGAKLCVLTPIFTIEAKYITIDTDVLHSLLGSVKGTGLNKTDFGHDQILGWIKNFRLLPKLFPDGREG